MAFVFLSLEKNDEGEYALLEAKTPPLSALTGGVALYFFSSAKETKRLDNACIFFFCFEETKSSWLRFVLKFWLIDFCGGFWSLEN